MTLQHRLIERAEDEPKGTACMNGTVKKIVAEKNFGFVKGDEDGVERFFHRVGSPDFDRLREGSAVTFEEEDSQKGPRATDVRLLTVSR